MYGVGDYDGLLTRIKQDSVRNIVSERNGMAWVAQYQHEFLNPVCLELGSLQMNIKKIESGKVNASPYS